MSVLAAIALPTFVAALFYIFIASDRYVSEARFAIRNNESQAIDALGMITGMPSSQLTSDSYIVADYVVSRDMVKELEQRLPFRTIYAKADFISRVIAAPIHRGSSSAWTCRCSVNTICSGTSRSRISYISKLPSRPLSLF